MISTSPDEKKRDSSRLLFIDALRGFALIGILFANLISFMGFYSLSPEQITSLHAIERYILFIIDWLVESKFYAIFSMLFGFSFILIKRNYNSSDFNKLWARRMLSLFLIGIIHMHFIWHGDILTLYSLLGLTLLLFYNLSESRLKQLIIILILAPFVIHILFTLSQDQPFWSSLKNITIEIKDSLNISNLSLLELRTSNNLWLVFITNILSAIPRWMSYLITGRISTVLAYFLIGLLIANKTLHLFEKGSFSKLVSLRVISPLLLVGLILSAYYAYVKYTTGSSFEAGVEGGLQNAAQLIGALLLSLSYILLLLKLFVNNSCESLFRLLATLGRMALTNYLSQTTICVFIFYGYGFSLMGRLSYYALPLIAITIIGAQYYFSKYWLKYHKSGPLEYLWRYIYKAN